ncbi:MAG: hypothetical protein ACTHJM_09000 [Marmoricola sp.]
MNSKMGRAFRATAAVAVVGSLIGLQALTSAANADTTITWMPSSGPSLWSDTNCTTDNSAPSSTPSTPPTDAQSRGGTQTYVADGGPHSTGASDVGWSYAPAATAQGGPVVTIPTVATTTGLSVDVQGATNGRLLVVYNTKNSNDGTVNYVGVWNFTTPSGWNTVTSNASSGALTWYIWVVNPITQAGSWRAANNQLVNLQVQNVPQSLSAFFKGKTGTAQAAFELGCGASFAIDHLKVTDSAAGVTDYNLQTPTSSTTISQGTSKITYGGSTTIKATTTVSNGGTTNPTDTVTLQSSTDGGSTWSTSATGAPGSTFTVKPTKNTKYRVQYASSTALNPQPSTSGQVSVAVGPVLKISASTTKVNIGKSVTFTARTTPALANRTVTFQQASGSSWVSLGSATTNSSGVATLTKSRSATGAWKVRSNLANVPGYAAVTSSSVSVGVYQPVSVSAYRTWSTVYLGNSLRIYGTVSPHSSGIALQLQQYVGGRWILVASGRTGSRGAYSFTKVARNLGTATFRVRVPASGYRKAATSSTVKVSIVRRPVYNPPPPPPPSGGGGGGGSGIG